MPGFPGDGPPMWWDRHGRHRGVGLAWRVGLVQVAGTALAAHGQSTRRPLDLVGYALLAAGPAALVVRRRAPLRVLAVTAATTAGYYALGYRYGPAFLSLLVAMFVAVGTGRRRQAWTLVGVSYAAYIALSIGVGREGQSVAAFVATAALLGFVLVLADGMHAGRERGRAAAQARQEQRRRQTSEERLRIAQELHDTLGHHLSAINVQAGVALHLGDGHNDQSASALAAIKQHSHEALDELRDVLAVLRDDDAAPRAPTPGLDRLEELLAQSRAAGLDVRLSREGVPDALPATVDRAAYRVVQEAVTNVRRHAGASRAEVCIRYVDDAVVVEVSDDGSSHGQVPEEGNGIAGMRARAAALGGSLELGRASAGGLRVTARLPVAP